MDISRRHLLAGMGMLPLLALSPRMALAGNWSRILVLVELAGGNDGLNMIVPQTDPLYRQLRPGIALSGDRLAPLDERFGLNTALASLMPAWRDGDLAVVQGVGYPDPDRSHFRSIDIWDTASGSAEVLTQGWLAQLFSREAPPGDFTTEGLVLGHDGAGPLAGAKRFVELRNPGRFVRDAKRSPALPAEAGSNSALQHIVRVQAEIDRAAAGLAGDGIAATAPGLAFPKTGLGQQLELAARVIAGQAQVAVIKVTLGGFDTHINQVPTQHRLLEEVGMALAAFRGSMLAAGLWDRVLVMTYSEFGRRAAENGSGGTDHGTAAPHFLLGGRVRGGFHGQAPSLASLENGDLRYTTDFRQLYSTILQSWWEVPSLWPDQRPLGLIA